LLLIRCFAYRAGSDRTVVLIQKNGEISAQTNFSVSYRVRCFAPALPLRFFRLVLRCVALALTEACPIAVPLLSTVCVSAVPPLFRLSGVNSGHLSYFLSASSG
jgi:hypothetical protein